MKKTRLAGCRRAEAVLSETEMAENLRSQQARSQLGNP